MQQLGIGFFSGLSSETKPTLTAVNDGVLFYETDTKKLYVFDSASGASGWAVIINSTHVLKAATDKGGIADTGTPAAGAVEGDYYSATTNGNYVNFAPPAGGIKNVAIGDKLIFDGTNWIREAVNSLIHHSNGIVTAPGASISAISTADGKVLVTKEYVLSSAIGAMEFKGNWDASTNTPTIPAPSADPVSGNKGWFYIVSVAGTITTAPPPAGSYSIGDWVVSDGTKWVKIDNTEYWKIDGNFLKPGTDGQGIAMHDGAKTNTFEISIDGNDATLFLVDGTTTSTRIALEKGATPSELGKIILTSSLVELTGVATPVPALAPQPGAMYYDKTLNKWVFGTDAEWMELAPPTIYAPLPPTISTLPTLPQLNAMLQYMRDIATQAGKAGVTITAVSPSDYSGLAGIAELQAHLNYAKAVDADIVANPTTGYIPPVAPADYSGSVSRTDFQALYDYQVAISNALIAAGVLALTATPPPVTSVNGMIGDVVIPPTPIPITTVNKKTGDVVINKLDVGITEQVQPTAPADPSGTVSLSEIQAILDYAKQISADLKAAGIYV